MFDRTESLLRLYFSQNPGLFPLSLPLLLVSQRCPGQVGGGWEEIDSSHSSSHNSCQETADHCQVSGGGSSNSGGTGSQSGASRESSGDLSERWKYYMI